MTLVQGTRSDGSTHEGVCRPIWRPWPLFLSHLGALLLLGSWLLPRTRAGWDKADAAVFHYLNGTLDSGPLWHGFWAILNWRPFDLVAGLLILFFLLWWLREGGRRCLRERVATFLLFALLLVATNVVFQVILQLLEYRRISPSGVFESAIRLSHVVTWIHPKDYSGLSFPSDHAFVLISSVVFFWFHGGPRLGLVVGITLVPFVLPRLVGGGHWLTDTLVGATFMSLISLSWWFTTPLHAHLTHWASRVGKKPLALLAGVLEKRVVPF